MTEEQLKEIAGGAYSDEEERARLRVAINQRNAALRKRTIADVLLEERDLDLEVQL